MIPSQEMFDQMRKFDQAEPFLRAILETVDETMVHSSRYDNYCYLVDAIAVKAARKKWLMMARRTSLELYHTLETNNYPNAALGVMIGFMRFEDKFKGLLPESFRAILSRLETIEQIPRVRVEYAHVTNGPSYWEISADRTVGIPVLEYCGSNMPVVMLPNPYDPKAIKSFDTLTEAVASMLECIDIQSKLLPLS